MRAVRNMRWNLLWYIPLTALILVYPVVFDLLEAYRYGREVLSRWRWILLVSPAADLWFAATVASVAIPLRTIFLLPISFAPDSEGYAKRYRNTLILLLEMALFLLISWVLIWGCYPFASDPDGIHIRMIPFYPWPANPFFPRRG